jgi:hypothetical protein
VNHNPHAGQSIGLRKSNFIIRWGMKKDKCHDFDESMSSISAMSEVDKSWITQNNDHCSGNRSILTLHTVGLTGHHT